MRNQLNFHTQVISIRRFTKTKGSITKAVAQRCFGKKVLLKISQNSQKNKCARVSFLVQ